MRKSREVERIALLHVYRYVSLSRRNSTSTHTYCTYYIHTYIHVHDIHVHMYTLRSTHVCSIKLLFPGTHFCTTGTEAVPGTVCNVSCKNVCVKKHVF